VAVTGDGLDRQRLRPALHARHATTPHPCALAPRGAAEAASRQPLPPHACTQPVGLIRAERWLKAFAHLAPTGLALMMRGAVVQVPLGRRRG
jgi:hypothetical protein